MKRIILFLVIAIFVVYSMIAALYYIDFGGEQPDDYMTLEYSFKDEMGVYVINSKGERIIVKQRVGLYYNKTNDQNETKENKTKLKGSNTFANEGYIIENWEINGKIYKAGSYLEAGLTKPIDGSAVKAEPTWTEKQYTVKYNSQGGSAFENTTVTYGANFGAAASVISVKKGYLFTGWWTTATSSSGILVTETTRFEDLFSFISKDTLTLYARWDPAPLTVTFDTNGGSGGNGAQSLLTGVSAVLDGGTPTIADKMTPNQTSYKFKCWNTNANGTGTNYNNGGSYSFTGDVTLYAQWQVRVYTINFDANGGSNGTMQTSKKFTSGVSAQLNSGKPSYPGKTFMGWSTISTSIGPQQGEPYQSNAYKYFYGENETFTLYAVWQDPYKITFNANGVAFGQQQFTPFVSAMLNGGTPTISDKIPPEVANRTSYKFKCWNTAANGTGTIYNNNSSYTFTSDMTLYAQWEARTYTVYFDANGGNPGSMITSKQFTSGVIQVLNAGTPSYSGKKFMGWSTDKNATTVQHNNNDSINVYGENDTVTLYAVWQDINVTFYANGAVISQQQFTPGAALNGGTPTTSDKIPPEVTYQTSYKFKCWNTAANGSGTNYYNGSYYTFTSDMTLYAQWEARTYTVYFDANGGSQGSMITSKQFVSGVPQLIAAGIPYWPGNTRTFVGWSTDKYSNTAQHYNNDQRYFYGVNEIFTLYAVWN